MSKPYDRPYGLLKMGDKKPFGYRIDLLAESKMQNDEHLQIKDEETPKKGVAKLNIGIKAFWNPL